MRRKITTLLLCSLLTGMAIAMASSWRRVSSEIQIESTDASVKNTVEMKLSRKSSATIPMGQTLRVNPVAKFAEDAGIDMYAFSSNDKDYTQTGVIKFNSLSPGSLTRPSLLSDDVTAGAAAGDKYYVMRTYQYFYPGGLCTVDLTSGEITEVASYIENPDVRQAIEMSYDYTTETMYMLFVSDDDAYSTAFGSVDLTTGAQAVINENMNRYVRAMAVDKDGVVYGIDQDGYLLTIDKQTGACTNLYDLDLTPFYRQSMDFNRTTGELYWAFCGTSGYSSLKKVDVSSGLITDLGAIGDGYEMTVGLHIPYALCAAESPAKPVNFSVVAATDGSLTAELSWTCPTLTYSGEELTSLESVEVYRDNELVSTLTDVQPGKDMTFTDVLVEKGVYTYKVVAINTEGVGAPAYSSVFVGRDVPEAVKFTSVKREGRNAISLAWEAPVEGVNKGYLDTESMRYTVTRLTDGAVLAEDITETSFTDNTITALARYRYQVSVSNADGDGGVTSTGYIVNGPARELPLKANFSKEDEANLWTVGDANGDGVFFFWQYNSQDGQGYYYYQTEWQEDADDWLISPLTRFEADKSYKMVVNARPAGSSFPEKMEFYLLKEYDLSTAVKLGETFDVEAVTLSNGTIRPSEYRVEFSDIEPGEYSVAVRCVSTAWDGYWLGVASVEVAENEDGNLRGDVWDDTENPVEGALVTVEGTEYSTLTDSRGQFEIEHIPAGEYTVRCTKEGYFDGAKSVKIKQLGSTTVELDMVQRKAYSVEGVITDEYGAPLADAAVVLSGYINNQTLCDANGKYVFAGVYEDENVYTLSASKDFYEVASQTVTVADADVEANLVLNDKIIAPAEATAYLSDDLQSAVVEWTKPGYVAEVKKHSDAGSWTFGAEDGDATSLVGVVCTEPVILESMKWTAYNTEKTMNVVVLALDEDGNATDEVLYIDEQASNSALQTTNYIFSEPVHALSGCFIGLSVDAGDIKILSAESTDEKPFIEGFNAYIESYTEDATLQYVESLGESYRENFFISFEGTILAGKEAPSVSYNIYRLDSSSVGKLLTDESVASFSFTDAEWTMVANGIYNYAVEAVYDNGKVSERTLTNTIEQKDSGVDSVVSQWNVEAVELYALDGTRVLTSEPQPGIYLARILSDGKWIVKKVVIK